MLEPGLNSEFRRNPLGKQGKHDEVKLNQRSVIGSIAVVPESE